MTGSRESFKIISKQLMSINKAKREKHLILHIQIVLLCFSFLNYKEKKVK